LGVCARLGTLLSGWLDRPRHLGKGDSHLRYEARFGDALYAQAKKAILVLDNHRQVPPKLLSNER